MQYVYGNGIDALADAPFGEEIIFSCIVWRSDGVLSRIVVQAGSRRPPEGISLRIGLRQQNDTASKANGGVVALVEPHGIE